MKKLFQALKALVKAPNFEQVKATGLAGLISAIIWYGELISTDLQEIRKDQVEQLQRTAELRDDFEDLEDRVVLLEEAME